MKKRNNRMMFMVLLALGIVFFYSMKAYAAPQNTMPIPKINISVDNANNPTEYVDNIKLLIMLTVLTLLPSFIVMMTSFVRTIVVFGFLRNAMGTQQSPPNQVMIGLALFLTLFIMYPVYSEVNTKAIQPYMKNKITQEQAVEIGAKPLRQFMLKQTRQKDLKLFVDLAKPNFKVTKDNAPLYIVVPAFIISELKTAFQIGFLLFIPFLIIDLVVASVLMSMGMFMLPPVMISLPFKLLLFVMVDGWYLLVKSLVMSFG
ncbi:flagellar type III secretion system pore protein FliP [Clostridium botulinum]|uniref:Flagellar biosynthetic protein FliP n=1 Tax=Clostridium botulinum (strain Langeland / NCTC 10281 / Type F) TaxID=441772 RepID=A7GGN9_CLOBL|nr:flagellar type III secretion system pore protein FliP [Clostridium botulinum]ABS42717.1 flagellar biosynthetic protein FliP [Clostridium botulinum F str. Langeland]ADG00345.1 flagellar biosynthetic protein FliP [Clostridium botulinum F str. 230613]KKM41165.1 flagellar biosynthesis protein flip [Clostridium botulinum]MBY6793844.1 flagellar type III secretion system pore protein FliP [Clostridium botulinum]MBY6937639.1 flagellar type III secretion system pore protein FliP [Clostridium botulin